METRRGADRAVLTWPGAGVFSRRSRVALSGVYDKNSLPVEGLRTSAPAVARMAKRHAPLPTVLSDDVTPPLNFPR
jgi:hypothetical protein